MSNTVPAALLQPSSPRRLVVSAALDWAVIVAGWWAIAYGPAWLYPPAALLVGGRLHALAVLAHEGAHLGAAHARGLAVVALEMLAGWPVGTTLPAMRAHHQRHHQDTNLATDPYAQPWRRPGRTAVAWLALMALYPVWVLRALVGTAASVLPRLRPAYAHLVLGRAGVRPLRDRELAACLAADRRFLPALVALAVASVLWPRAMALYYFLPLVIALALNAHRFLREHTAEQAADRRLTSLLAVTRDLRPGWLARLLLAPHNVGYHVVHHLHPRAGYAALPRLDAWYRANCPQYRGQAAGG